LGSHLISVCGVQLKSNRLLPPLITKNEGRTPRTPSSAKDGAGRRYPRDPNFPYRPPTPDWFLFVQSGIWVAKRAPVRSSRKDQFSSNHFAALNDRKVVPASSHQPSCQTSASDLNTERQPSRAITSPVVGRTVFV